MSASADVSMSLWVAISLWWIMGATSIAFLSWQGLEAFTWADLFRCCLLGILGPALWVFLAFVILIRAGFWSKPIFPKPKQ